MRVAAQAHGGRLVRLERQGRRRGRDVETTHRPARRRHLRRHRPAARKTIRNITTASPTACCGRSCITGSTSPNSRAAISAAICGSTSISPTELRRICEPDDLVWVHDYHLHPARRRCCASAATSNRIGFFLHIPFPPPDMLTALPNHERLHPALCALRSGRLPDRRATPRTSRAIWQPRCRHAAARRPAHFDAVRTATVRVGAFPVGIETAAFQRLARRAVRSPVRARGGRDSLAGRALIIGVDRLDYSKGLVQRMEAFEHFLAAYPEWRGKVTYLQITPKSRSRHPRICRHGADDRARRPAASTARYGEVVLDADPLRQPRLQPHGAGRALSLGACRRWSRRCATA